MNSLTNYAGAGSAVPTYSAANTLRRISFVPGIPSQGELDRLLLNLERDWEEGVRDEDLGPFEKALDILETFYAVHRHSEPALPSLFSPAFILFSDKWEQLKKNLVHRGIVPDQKECRDMYQLVFRFTAIEAKAYLPSITLFCKTYKKFHPKAFTQDEAKACRIVGEEPPSEVEKQVEEDLKTPAGRERVFFAAMDKLKSYSLASFEDPEKVLNELTGELNTLWDYYAMKPEEECPTQQFQNAAVCLRRLYEELGISLPSILNTVTQAASLRK